MNMTTVVLTGTIKRETAKAILFEIEEMNDQPIKGGTQQEWFPLSQTQSITRAAAGSDEYDYLLVSQWIVEQKDIALDLSKNLEKREEKEADLDWDNDIPF